jgi:hypothetical protein
MENELSIERKKKKNLFDDGVLECLKLNKKEGNIKRTFV